MGSLSVGLASNNFTTNGQFCPGWSATTCTKYSTDDVAAMVSSVTKCEATPTCTAATTWAEYCASTVFPDCKKARLAGCIKADSPNSWIQEPVLGARKTLTNCIEQYPPPQGVGCWIRSPRGHC